VRVAGRDDGDHLVLRRRRHHGGGHHGVDAEGLVVVPVVAGVGA
jgi:hypothetical protein